MCGLIKLTELQTTELQTTELHTIKRTGKPVVLKVEPSKVRGVLPMTDVATHVPLG